MIIHLPPYRKTELYIHTQSYKHIFTKHGCVGLVSSIVLEQSSFNIFQTTSRVHHFDPDNKLPSNLLGKSAIPFFDIKTLNAMFNVIRQYNPPIMNQSTRVRTGAIKCGWQWETPAMEAGKNINILGIFQPSARCECSF